MKISPTNQYRKKPIVIEARLHLPIPDHAPESVFEAWEENGRSIIAWVNDNSEDRSAMWEDTCISIETLEGVMFANPGDWIIRGVKGEFYPCKPDVFEATYETVATHEGSLAIDGELHMTSKRSEIQDRGEDVA